MNATMFLVLGREEYEGFDILRLFHTRINAAAFAALCDDHRDAEPRCPSEDASDSEWEKYERARKRWAAKHPAGKGHAAYPHYDVDEIDVGDKP